MTENQTLDRILVVGAEDERLKELFQTRCTDLQKIIEKQGLVVVQVDEPEEPEEAALEHALMQAQKYEMLEPYVGSINFDNVPFYKKLDRKGGKKRKRGRFY